MDVGLNIVSRDNPSAPQDSQRVWSKKYIDPAPRERIERPTAPADTASRTAERL